MHPILPQMLLINRRWELCLLKSYKDKDQKWHAGWGTGPEMAAKFGITIDENTVLTQAQADVMHSRSLSEFFAPELEHHLDLSGIEVNDYQFNALLDILYNRGGGRLVGSDQWGHKEGDPWFKGSYAWHLMKQKGMFQRMENACKALVFSHVDDWTPLDEAFDKALGHDRVYLGLTLRRFDDASLFQMK